MAAHKVTLRLSDEAFDGWDACATEASVSLSALAEAIGLTLHEGGFTAAQGRQIVERARQIDLERRRRRRR